MTGAAAFGKLHTLFLTLDSYSAPSSTTQAYAKLRAAAAERRITLHAIPWRPEPGASAHETAVGRDAGDDAATGTGIDIGGRPPSLQGGGVQALDARLSSMMEELGISLSADVDFQLGPGGRDAPDNTEEEEECAFE